MRKLLLFTALVVLTARAFCREKELHVGCDEVAEGKTRNFPMLITTLAGNPHKLKLNIRLKNLGGMNKQPALSGGQSQMNLEKT